MDVGSCSSDISRWKLLLVRLKPVIRFGIVNVTLGRKIGCQLPLK